MKIAYLMSRFPLLSETFILREMIEVECQGHEVVMYPLICQHQPVVHEEAMEWNSRANCIPFFSLAIFTENLKTFFQHPSLYFSLVWHIFKDNLSSFDFLTKSLFLFPKAVYTSKCLKMEGVDHIHAHYATYPALIAWITHQLTGISYSITIHSHDIFDCQAMLETKLRDALFLVPISNYNVEFMASHVGDWIRKKCHVIHCGVNLSQYRSIANRNNKKETDIFEILQIGSLHWKKGQVYLLQAIASLRNQGVPIHLRIIGEGNERSNLEREIENLNLENVVELLGARTQEEVANLLPSADCYVQSSVSEGIPVAIMEAMACELPVVATNITGIPELVMDGKTGLLTSSHDPEALAKALAYIKKNPEHAALMGKHGRIWVQEQFDLEKNVANLIILFERYRQNISI
jgi:colanic acid/amylovoran biosynthesis glycosyltransferase